MRLPSSPYALPRSLNLGAWTPLTFRQDARFVGDGNPEPDALHVGAYPDGLSSAASPGGVGV